MNTFEAFTKGEANRGKEMMVFDWDRAAQLIKEKQPKEASAGLSGDWGWTGGTIYALGEIVEDDYTYLASTWATPELHMDGEELECFKMESELPDWDAQTKWPESARKILEV